MLATQYLQNSDDALNSGGYLDVMYQRFAAFVNTAGVVTAANLVIDKIIAERNYVHSSAVLNDGITDVAAHISAASADDKGKMLYITKGLMDAYETSIMFPGNVDTDPTIGWGSVLSPAPTPIANTPNPPSQVAQTFKNFAKPNIGGGVYNATVAVNRLAVLDKLYALYAAVAAL